MIEPKALFVGPDLGKRSLAHVADVDLEGWAAADHPITRDRQRAKARLAAGEEARLAVPHAHLELARTIEADVVGHIERESTRLADAPNEGVDILDLTRMDQIALRNLAQPPRGRADLELPQIDAEFFEDSGERVEMRQIPQTDVRDHGDAEAAPLQLADGCVGPREGRPRLAASASNSIVDLRGPIQGGGDPLDADPGERVEVLSIREREIRDEDGLHPEGHQALADELPIWPHEGLSARQIDHLAAERREVAAEGECFGGGELGVARAAGLTLAVNAVEVARVRELPDAVLGHALDVSQRQRTVEHAGRRSAGIDTCSVGHAGGSRFGVAEDLAARALGLTPL